MDSKNQDEENCHTLIRVEVPHDWGYAPHARLSRKSVIFEHLTRLMLCMVEFREDNFVKGSVVKMCLIESRVKTSHFLKILL